MGGGHVAGTDLGGKVELIIGCYGVGSQPFGGGGGNFLFRHLSNSTIS